MSNGSHEEYLELFSLWYVLSTGSRVASLERCGQNTHINLVTLQLNPLGAALGLFLKYCFLERQASM